MKTTNLAVVCLVLRTVSGECNCYNETTQPRVTICNCHGLVNVSHMSNVNFLTVRDSNECSLKNNYFRDFESTVTDISLTEFFSLKEIENDTFNKFVNLQSLYIARAPQLASISLDILVQSSKKIRFLRIIKSGLRSIPKIGLSNFINIIDFESNRIKYIKSNNIQVMADQLNCDYNEIEAIEGWAFNNSQISKISLKGNRKLQTLHDYAFAGLKSLSILDLSETSIRNIPTIGMNDLESLIMKRVFTLKSVPSIFDFENLKETQLTYSLHCCAFQLPMRHDPVRYAKQMEYIERIKASCANQSKTVFGETTENITREQHIEDEEIWHSGGNAEITVMNLLNNNLNSVFENRRKMYSANCGTVSLRKDRSVSCIPMPDAFNPCEDIMGYRWLRFTVWFVLLAGLVGNACVLAVFAVKKSEITVQNFLITNLATSDFCTALFLLIVAIEDLVSQGYYFNFAYDWQTGLGCKIAGFITIFASQLSIYILCLLTIERWFSIKRALYMNKLNLRNTVIVTICGWIYAIVVATMPILGISSYATTSICLPMKTETIPDKMYILTLLFFSCASFVLICICYYQIYNSLSFETRHHGEYALAKRIGILVATNFLCTVPITFFAFTAILGYPLISITNSKVLLVFFYPINACANPFLYAILTANFRRDLTTILSKFGICPKSIQQYPVQNMIVLRKSKHEILRPSTSHTSL